MTQANTVNSLPLPDQDASEHSGKVKQCLIDKIAVTGSISFSEYMDTTLYEPGLGYYSAGSTKLGDEGDFITAPEISSLFSQSIAQAILPALESLDECSILEVGAGSGKMAAAILEHLDGLNRLPTHYYILELSADLQLRQKELLKEKVPNFYERIIWLDSIPENLNAVVVANELLDAMPVVRFKKGPDGIAIEHVKVVDGEFQFSYSPNEMDEKNQSEILLRAQQRVKQIEEIVGKLEDGFISEINFSAEDWLASIAEKLNSGVIILIDYGYPRHEYYHPQRNEGTLNCFYRHRHHNNPFLYPGLQDLTAHIDFTAIADSGIDNGLKLVGYTSQTNFLFGAGIAQLAEARNQTYADDDIISQIELSNKVKKLTMPFEMGEIVKVIGFSKNCQTKLAAFDFKDMCDHL